MLECVEDRGRRWDPATRFVARFGYKNPNASAVSIAIEPRNGFYPAPRDRGQPTEFLPGRQSFVFEVTFNGRGLIWILNGRAVVVPSHHAPRCK